MVALWPVEHASHARDLGCTRRQRKGVLEDVLEDSVRVAQKKTFR